MFVVMVATECAPVAQAGGLGDVVFGLSRELELRGNSVEIVLPKYDCLRYDRIYGLTVAYDDLWVPWFDGAIHCTVWFGWVDGRKCFFIEPHSDERFFARGHLYGSADDVARFAFFSKAALEFMFRSGKRPDIIHCHDWETALVPVLLFEIYQSLGMQDQRVCLTVHNFRHQGVTSEWVLQAVGLTDHARFFDQARLEDDFNPGTLNLLKGGIVYSNFVTTVSPQHAWEARYTDQGAGLGHTLHVHGGKFRGILNGVDYATWNPEVDQWIPQQYSAATIDEKHLNTRVLRERFMLREESKPIVAYVGRLDHQKGVGLIRHAIFFALAQDAQFVLLGAGSDDEIAGRFSDLKHHLNDHPDVHLELRFDHELAHLVYAGADLLVMPSLFEPCGLVQQVAVKYGTVPVVRAIGGVVDTVFDHDYSDVPPEQRNGFVFHHVDGAALESAMARAIKLWHRYPGQFRQLRLNGMRADRSWAHPGRAYLNVYDYVRHRDAAAGQPEHDHSAARDTIDGAGRNELRLLPSRRVGAPSPPLPRLRPRAPRAGTRSGRLMSPTVPPTQKVEQHMPAKPTSKAAKRTSKAAKPTSRARSATAKPGQDAIAQRAYEISQTAPTGDPVSDWLKAERELTPQPRPRRSPAQ